MLNSDPGTASVRVTEASPAGNLYFTSLRTTTIYFCALIFLWALIYIPDMSSRPLMDDMDALHAEAAREMLQRHDYVTLHVNGIRYLEKSPLPYWLTAASYAKLGFTELATRLPISLFALFAILATFWLGRDIAGDEAGFYSALVFGTAVGPYLYTRFFIPDIAVCLWLTISVHLIFKAFESAKSSWLLSGALGLVTALNVLTKGLIGVVFPSAIIIGYLLAMRDFRLIRKIRPVFASLVFFVVAAPWHILATLRNPAQGAAKGFFWYYFINDQIYRYLNRRVPHDYNKVPLLLFWALVLIWLVPWCGYVLASLRQVPVRWRSIQTDSRMKRACLLLFIWAVVIVGFFTFSSRQEYYILPALPALAVLTGMWLAREAHSDSESALHRSGLRVARITAVVAGIVGACLLLIAKLSPPLPPGMDFASALKKAPDAYTLSLGHLFDLTPRAMGAFRVPLLLTGLALLLGPALSLYYRRRLRRFQANVVTAVMMVVVFFAVHQALFKFMPILGSKPLAMTIQKEFQPGDVIVADGEYSTASSIAFYTGQPIHPLNVNNANLWFGSLFPDAPHVFENDASVQSLWRGPNRVFFVTADEHARGLLEKFGAPVFEIQTSGDKVLFSNRAAVRN